jgi:hypothetical protein
MPPDHVKIAGLDEAALRELLPDLERQRVAAWARRDGAAYARLTTDIKRVHRALGDQPTPAATPNVELFDGEDVDRDTTTHDAAMRRTAPRSRESRIRRSR